MCIVILCVPGKTRFWVDGLVVAGNGDCTVFWEVVAGNGDCTVFWEVEAHIQMYPRFSGLQKAFITWFLCKNVVLKLFPKESQFEEIILVTIWS